MRMSQPGPPSHANAASWRRWLLPAAIAAGFVTLLTLPRGAAPGMALSYTKFLADVGAGTVRAVTIGPAGQVTGSLAGGQPFTSAISASAPTVRTATAAPRSGCHRAIRSNIGVLRCRPSPQA